MEENNAVEIVHLRNEFYRDSYRRVMRVLMLSIILTVVAFLMLAYIVFNPPKPKYFAVTPSGTLTPIIPLDQPNLSQQAVIQWATQAAAAAYTFDFVNYRKNLQAASQFFTPSGWNYFISALQASRNLNTITEKKLVVSAVVTKAPVINWQGTLPDGAYGWRIEVPLTVSYQSPSVNTSTPLVVTMTIRRVPTIYSARGIGIEQFVVSSASSPVG